MIDNDSILVIYKIKGDFYEYEAIAIYCIVVQLITNFRAVWTGHKTCNSRDTFAGILFETNCQLCLKNPSEENKLFEIQCTLK